MVIDNFIVNIEPLRRDVCI